MASFVKVLRKNGYGWQAIIRRKGVKPIKKTFDTKGAAKHWASEKEAEILAKKYRDPRLAQKMTLGKGLEEYRKEGELKGKASSTLDREKYSRKNLERLLGATTTIGDIDSIMVNIYQRDRIYEGASNSSIRQELAMLSKMFRIANRVWRIPVDNPVDSIERVPPSPGRERFLTTEEARLVIEEARNSSNPKFYPFVLLLMHTGMRSGEAARLTVDSVDLKKRCVVIHKTKSGKPRSVPLTKDAAKALKTIKPEKDGYLFLRPNHLAAPSIMLRPGCIFRECWKRAWERLEKKHQDQENNPGYPKIEKFRPHDIRHTAASHLLMAGVDIREVADILGHSTLKMAMRYTHLLESHRQKTVDKIGKLGIT